MKWKDRSRFQKITFIFVILMLVATLGSVVMAALSAVGMFQ